MGREGGFVIRITIKQLIGIVLLLAVLGTVGYDYYYTRQYARAGAMSYGWLAGSVPPGEATAPPVTPSSPRVVHLDKLITDGTADKK